MPASIALPTAAPSAPGFAPSPPGQANAPASPQRAQAAPAASSRPLTNPSMHLDLALNLVVLEFTDDQGNVVQSIPSQKQLQAYRDQDAGPQPA